MRQSLALLVLALPLTASASKHEGPAALQPNSKVYLSDMGGFQDDLSAALMKKKVPVLMVTEKDKADYVISGKSSVESASWSKRIFVSQLPAAHSSITVTSVASGAVVFAYSVDKENARRGEQSTAEACAKHLKEVIY